MEQGFSPDQTEEATISRVETNLFCPPKQESDEQREQRKALNRKVALKLAQAHGTLYLDDGEKPRLIQELKGQGVNSDWWEISDKDYDAQGIVNMLVDSYPVLLQFLLGDTSGIQPRNEQGKKALQLIKEKQKSAKTKVSVFEGGIRFDQNPNWRDKQTGESNPSIVLEMRQARRYLEDELKTQLRKLKAKLEWEQTRDQIFQGILRSLG